METLHPVICPSGSFGFRVMGYRDNAWMNLNVFGSRANQARTQLDLTNETAVDHLLWNPVVSPWVSIFCDWDSAITFREYLHRAGAEIICIAVLDLDVFRVAGTDSLRGVVDGYSVAAANNLANSHFYGHVIGPRQGRSKVYLVSEGIPDRALVAILQASGDAREVPFCGMMLRASSTMIHEAGGADEEAIKQWIARMLYRKVGARSQEYQARLEQALCSEDVSSLHLDVVGALRRNAMSEQGGANHPDEVIGSRSDGP